MEMGYHILGNLKDCPAHLLKNKAPVEKILKETASEAKLNVVGESFYQFDPDGVTGVLVLSESHLSVHTWPELSSVAVDVFSCKSKESAVKAFDLLVKKFEAKKFDKTEVER